MNKKIYLTLVSFIVFIMILFIPIGNVQAGAGSGSCSYYLDSTYYWDCCVQGGNYCDNFCLD